MNKVITINLNGRAYQVEEDGYQELQKYLQEAGDKLKDDPDKTEIMNDLEQALAEKLERFLRAHKTVISKSEALEVIKEMGPVKNENETNEGKTAAAKTSEDASQAGAKRLYRIRDGAMISGVCTGLAAYFDIDVTVIRILFVILTLLTHGIGILVYLIMIVVVPSANTSAEKAAASGAPFTAQEFIDRARAEYNKFAEGGKWKHEWHRWKQEMRQRARQERQQWKQQRRQQRSQYFVSPFWGILIALLSLVWVLGLISLITKGAILGVALPASVPLWIGILVWVCLYAFVMSPLHSVRHGGFYSNSTGGYNNYHHDGGFLEAVAWLAFFVVVGWSIWHYVPQSHHYGQSLVTWLHHTFPKLFRN